MKEKNKIILFISVIVILFIGLLLYGKSSKSGNKEINTTSNQILDVSVLKAPETFYDFGTISMKNGNVSKVFKVNNETNADILIPSLTTSCMCTTAYIIKEDGSRSRPFGMPGHGGAVPKANEIIKAGGSLDIEVVYDPNAHGPAGVGMIDRFVYLGDTNGNKIQFEIKANVTP